MNAIDAYDEILRLSLDQGEALRSGDLERLLSLLIRRGEIMASLPTEPDGAWEWAQRQRIARLDSAQEMSLLAWRDQAATELDELQRSRIGLEGYRVSAPIDTVFIDRTC